MALNIESHENGSCHDDALMTTILITTIIILKQILDSIIYWIASAATERHKTIETSNYYTHVQRKSFFPI